MFDLSAIQSSIRESSLDGWLLYDFRGANVLARRVLDMEGRGVSSRRFFYFIPAGGAPQKLVHRIESGALDHLPGERNVYLRWQELEQGVKEILAGRGRVAMEYSPRNANPYVSRVDAGTIELVRSLNVDVVSSGDLVQMFEALWDDEQWHMHLEAEKHTTSSFDRVWEFIAERVRDGGAVRETEVQRLILDHFQENGLVTDHPPIVAVGPHSGDPHYSPEPGEQDTAMKEGDFVLVDQWAKLDRPRAVYSDLTRVAYLGESTPERYEKIFQIVAKARDAAIDLVRDAFAADEPLQGWQVDQAARGIIEQAGYGDYFVHRTGHSIGQETHGNGANCDNLETRDERRILKGACFSIEPGIYLPEFGVRSEVNVFVDRQGQVHVTGGPVQQEVTPVLR